MSTPPSGFTFLYVTPASNTLEVHNMLFADYESRHKFDAYVVEPEPFLYAICEYPDDKNDTPLHYWRISMFPKKKMSLEDFLASVKIHIFPCLVDSIDYPKETQWTFADPKIL